MLGDEKKRSSYGGEARHNDEYQAMIDKAREAIYKKRSPAT